MSLDDAVMPTSVLVEAPSATVLAAILLFLGWPLATSVTAMSKLCELVSVPSEACTVIVYLWPAAALLSKRSEERRVGNESRVGGSMLQPQIEVSPFRL